MPLYEHVFLARQDVSQAQVEALQKEYTDVITEGGSVELVIAGVARSQLSRLTNHFAIASWMSRDESAHVPACRTRTRCAAHSATCRREKVDRTDDGFWRFP